MKPWASGLSISPYRRWALCALDEEDIIGTYERQRPAPSFFQWDFTPAWAKELGRSIDYLQQRQDIDPGRIALSGLSLGAHLGPVFAALEERLRTVIMVAGGAIDDKVPPHVDPVNFARRAKASVLMINGQDDAFCPRAMTGRMFDLLGTKDKRQVFVEGGHAPARVEQVKAEILVWLDTHLGKVRTKQ